MTINVNSLRDKVHQVRDTVAKLATRGLRAIVIVITETKLEPAVEITLPGFYCPSRRDRDRNGGGVVVFVEDAYLAFESYKADADGNVEAAEISMLGADGSVACRFLGVYRPPDSGVAAFATIDERAAAAAAADEPLVVLGDLNVPRFDGAQQSGEWRRAPKARPNTTPVADRLSTLLAERDMTVTSGLVGSVGLGERRTSTFFRGAVASELDFILADEAALPLVRSTGTESRRSAWGFSDHRVVWAGLELEAARLPPPVRPRFPAARWRFADADARDAYAAYLDWSLEPVVAELEANGLRHWAGDVQAVVREIVDAIHDAEAETIGVSSGAGGPDPTPPWWDDWVERAAGRLDDASTALSAAATAGDARRRATAIADVRRCKAEFDRRVAAARAAFFEWRLVEARHDPRALSAVYDELRAHLGQKRARGGRGTAHVWRALSTPDGRRVVGDAIAAELEAQVAAAFGYDADDPRFDADAAAALEREAAGIRRSPALAAECAAPSYENGGEDIYAEDVADAKRTVKLQKVAHPDDGVVPEALVYGGPVLDRALALVFTFVLRTGLVPADWLSGAMRCVYKRGCSTVFTNFRGVVLSGHIAKLFERVLLKRLLRVARGVDEAQAVTNAPVDCRCQLHLLYDIILANSGRVWLMALDITRGFPSTSRALTVTALRRHGVGGRLLRAIVGLIHGTSVVVGLRPGVETRRVKLLVGLLEGAVLSPALFAFACSGPLCALRESGLGVRVGRVHVPALMLMDDVILLARSRGELRAMAAVVFEWCWKNRFVLALANKSHIQAPATASTTETRLVWSPEGGSAVADIDATFPHRRALKYLGVRFAARGGPDAHIQQQLGIAKRVVEKMEFEYGGRAVVTFNQALLMWTIHGRVHVEWPAAVLAPPRIVDGRPGFDATVSYEYLQERALVAILGRSAGGTRIYEVLLSVFGLWRIDERRRLARARYAHVFARTQRRPWRASIFAELTRRVESDDDFGHESVTGAVHGALSDLGLDWPAVAGVDLVADTSSAASGDWDDDEEMGSLFEAAGARLRAEAAAEATAERAGAADATGADDDRDADVDGGRPPRADGDGRESDGDGSDAEADEEQPDSTAAQRAWNADMRRRCVDLVKDREAELFAKKEPPKDAEFKFKSAALWREIAEENPNGAQYSRLRYWMRTCVFGLTADETGTALVALLCGCWWAAPVGRQLVDGVGVPSTCAACGATSECLAVHLLLGKCDGEAACSCPEADEIRLRWEEEVDDLYTAHANSHPAAVADYLTAPPRSLRRVALMIGRARGVKVPWGIASELPRVFTRTWGAWSRLKLEEAAGAAAG